MSGGSSQLDLWSPDRYERAASMPHLIAASVRVAWAAGRRDLTWMAALQVLVAGGVFGEIFLGRALLSDLLRETPRHGPVGDLLPETIGLAAILALLRIALALVAHHQRLLAERCSRYGENEVLAVAATVELAAFDRPGFHDQVARALHAVRMLPSVVNGLGGLLRSVSVVIAAAMALLLIQPLFALGVGTAFFPTWWAARRRGRELHRFMRSITPQDRERRYLAQLLTDRDAAKELRAYALATHLRERHDRLWQQRLDALEAVARRQLRVTILADVAASAIVGGALVTLIALTLDHHVSLAGAGAVAAAILLLGQRLVLAAAGAGQISESALYIDDYLRLRTAPRPPAVSVSAGRPAGAAVGLHDVTFTYPGASSPALRGVTVEIAPGEVVALVGENGSGKTTLTKVLAGLYEPDSGTVAGSESAVLFQDYLRYTLSARDNVGFGDHARRHEDEAIQRAARATGADAVIGRLRDGYDTMLGPAFEGGTDLSLGQWQKIAVARALFRDAPLVILDEPTAALDAQAEHDLFTDIREQLGRRSVLLVTHRFASVRTADRIHVMKDGAIVESGTHDELIAARGRYAELFALQARPFLV